eukprot:11792-Heterococcus_DN1.PRE.2
MPPSATDDNGGGTEAVKARDLNGKVLSAVEWIATHKPIDRELVMVSTDRYDSFTSIFNEFKCMRNSSDTQLHRTRGSKGEATYVMMDNEGRIMPFGLAATCTHMGCVVPWVRSENEFICPCHASRYDANGKRGSYSSTRRALVYE